MEKLIKLLKKLDDNLIKILLIIFIFLAPLYPKLPIRTVNYTYIAVRLEDLYMVGLMAVFFVQVLRKKIAMNEKFLRLFLLFWLAAAASYLWGYFIQKTVLISHLGLLHVVRRIEYMILFFIAASSVKSKKDFWYFLFSVIAALTLVNVYGLGQKFFGWPAVQTMNPEYAKGYLLFLTPEARISSTFSGHYDLAAYLIFLMPILLGVYFLRKNLYYLLLFALSLLILIFTASRASYLAYLLSTFPFLIFIKKLKYFVLVLLLTVFLTLASKSLTARFERTFQVKQIFVNQATGQVVVPQKITSKELPAGSFYIGLNKSLLPSSSTQTASSQEKLLKEQLLADIRAESKRTGRKLTIEEEYQLAASLAATLKPISTIVSDISFATRLQVEWPRAIVAFIRNPILGSGPSSITEATDNDYLRSLGEFGLLGTTLFALILFNIVRFIIKASGKLKTDERNLYLSFLFGMLGLMINAGYIDVFEASKVAFQFWIMAGLFVGSLL